MQEGDYDYDEKKWISPEIKEKRTYQNDETLIANWNSVVAPNDKVYHLGDFAFVKKDLTLLNKYISRLNGEINLVLGNHDNYNIYKKANFKSITNDYEGKMINIYGQEIFLNHFKNSSWDKSHYGVWHLYGHSHGMALNNIDKLSFDCGVDVWNYKPINFYDVKEEMSKKEFIPINCNKR